jgi:competence protein ComEC
MLALGGGMLAGAWLAMRLPSAPPWLWRDWRLPASASAWAGAGGPRASRSASRSPGWRSGRALEDRLAPSLDGTHVEIVGIVEDLPQREARRLVLTLRLAPGEGLPSRARISWYEPAATPRPGEQWRFRAKLQRPRGVVNTGSQSREAWLLRQQIGATGYASGAVAGERLNPDSDWLLGLRGRSAAHIAATVADPAAAAVLTAITLGFRGGLDAATREALAATGTGHLLAISGLHIGLAAAAGGLLGGALGRRFGARWRPARDWAALGALALALGYCLLAGMPVSARRAVLMTAAALVALLVRRGGSLAAAFGGALALVLAPIRWRCSIPACGCPSAPSP